MLSSVLGCCLGISGLLLLPELAQAHAVFPGSAGFTRGLMHPVLVVPHLLLILVLGLMLGRDGLEHAEKPLILLILTTLAGLALTFALPAPEVVYLTIAGLVLWLALGLVTNLKPAASLIFGIMLLCGFLLGWDASQPADTIKEKLMAYAGTLIAVYALLVFVCAAADQVMSLRWGPIAVRVAGSWLAAVSLLFLVFKLFVENNDYY